MKISVSTVNYNKAAVGNGGGIWAFGNVVVAGDQTVGANKKVHTYFAGVSANSAYLNGGGIYSAQGTVSVSIGHVMSNVASYRNGGGIYESNGTAIVNAQGARVWEPRFQRSWWWNLRGDWKCNGCGERTGERQLLTQ